MSNYITQYENNYVYVCILWDTKQDSELDNKYVHVMLFITAFFILNTNKML